MTKRVVVITGAGRGIGRATAEAFAQAGTHGVLAARSQAESLHVSVDEIVLGHNAGAL